MGGSSEPEDKQEDPVYVEENTTNFNTTSADTSLLTGNESQTQTVLSKDADKVKSASDFNAAIGPNQSPGKTSLGTTVSDVRGGAGEDADIQNFLLAKDKAKAEQESVIGSDDDQSGSVSDAVLGASEPEVKTDVPYNPNIPGLAGTTPKGKTQGGFRGTQEDITNIMDSRELNINNADNGPTTIESGEVIKSGAVVGKSEIEKQAEGVSNPYLPPLANQLGTTFKKAETPIDPSVDPSVNPEIPETGAYAYDESGELIAESSQMSSVVMKDEIVEKLRRLENAPVIGAAGALGLSVSKRNLENQLEALRDPKSQPVYNPSTGEFVGVIHEGLFGGKVYSGKEEYQDLAMEMNRNNEGGAGSIDLSKASAKTLNRLAYEEEQKTSSDREQPVEAEDTIVAGPRNTRYFSKTKKKGRLGSSGAGGTVDLETILGKRA